jgi:hypothetical protein
MTDLSDVRYFCCLRPVCWPMIGAPPARTLRHSKTDRLGESICRRAAARPPGRALSGPESAGEGRSRAISIAQGNTWRPAGPLENKGVRWFCYANWRGFTRNRLSRRTIITNRR